MLKMQFKQYMISSEDSNQHAIWFNQEMLSSEDSTNCTNMLIKLNQ